MLISPFLTNTRSRLCGFAICGELWLRALSIEKCHPPACIYRLFQFRYATKLYAGEKTGRFWHLKNQHLLQRIDPFLPPLLLIAYSSSRKYPTNFLMLLFDLCCLKNRSRGCDFGVGAGANIGSFFSDVTLEGVGALGRW